jgi:hypothetical protein
MNHVRIRRRAAIAAACLLALVLVAMLAGCGGSSGGVQPGTAKQGFAAAQSALSTTAPDAKLLLVQSAAEVTPTAAPVWAFLFGSPKDDKTYVVYIQDSKMISTAEYGTAGLSAEEWAEVPSSDAWTMDSDVAYEKALTASGAKSAPAGYNMGFLTYVPQTETTSTTKPFVWYVSFNAGTSGASTGNIEVDMKTGAATAE